MSQTALPHLRRSTFAALAAVLGLVASSAALVASTAPASAGGPPPPPPIFVETTEDVVDPADGLLSLREAVDEANADAIANQIVLQEDATYVLDECGGGTDESDNVGGDLDHTAQELLWILGNGATIEQTCADERVLHDLDPDQPLFLEDLTITGGRTAGSGGGVNLGGGGQLDGVTVEGNTSGHVNGGGGVAAALGLVVRDSTIRDNVAAGPGGGLRSFDDVHVLASVVHGNTSAATGGGVSGGVEVVLLSSTVTQNRALGSGGGVHSASDSTTVGLSTVTANRAPTGANVLSGGTIEVDGGVIALGSDGADCETGDPVLQNGGSVGYDSSCGTPHGTDVPTAHPMLGSLAVPDGGATAAHAPTVGSPVIDVFATCPLDWDQHGNERPEGPACDAGAVEDAPEACAPTFTDVGGAHPFFDEICWLDQAGITSGYGDGSFGAGQPVTRQAMAAFIYRLAMSPPPPLLPPTFPDVALDHPFATEIGWLADEGISTGYGDGTFRPGDVVTRQAMAAFLFRVADPSAVALPLEPTFSDVSEAHPFYGEIEWMSSAGVSTGYPDGTWQPAAPVTRQAMAAFLQRMAQDVDLDGL